MVKAVYLTVILGLVATSAGCMHEGTEGAGGHGGNHDASTSSSSSGDGGSGGTGGSGGGSSGPPQAPIMTSVAPLQGGLHVKWDNVTPDCDKIELDRNKDGGAFATAFTLVGAATSQHDASVAASGTYCYKARCIKSAETSPDSNEKCGTP
jgi:hypothetical protein